MISTIARLAASTCATRRCRSGLCLEHRAQKPVLSLPKGGLLRNKRSDKKNIRALDLHQIKRRAL
jgi:hypothetical protein